MDHQNSKAIYDIFMQGRFINKQTKQGDRLVPDPLFNELSNEVTRPEYEQLFKAIGYQLVQLGDCFFVNKLSEYGEMGEVAMRIQGLIDILNRALGLLSTRAQCLRDFKGGLSWEDVEKFNDNEEFTQIVKALGLKGRFSEEVTKVLIGRGVAMLNHRDRLVFTDAGIALVDHYLSEYE